MKPKIFVALSTFAQYGDAPLSSLQTGGMDFSINPLGRRLEEKDIVRFAKDCQGIIAGVEPYNSYVLDHLPYLLCISRCGVGIDNIDLNKARHNGVKICHTADVVIQPVAELTVAMALDLLKKLTYHTELMREGRWEKASGYLLKGKAVGILGTGRIGKRVAEMMKMLGAEVYGADLEPDLGWAKKMGVQMLSTWELLKLCDIVSIHLSYQDQHPFQLGKQEIALMKKGAFVINVARGQFVDEGALYDALEKDRLGGAALDVYSQEPYAGPLCRLKNVILTPHIGTFTKESRLQMELEATNNLIEYLRQND